VFVLFSAMLSQFVVPIVGLNNFRGFFFAQLRDKEILFIDIRFTSLASYGAPREVVDN
jgi:hypothetical protein